MPTVRELTLAKAYSCADDLLHVGPHVLHSCLHVPVARLTRLCQVHLTKLYVRCACYSLRLCIALAASCLHLMNASRVSIPVEADAKRAILVVPTFRFPTTHTGSFPELRRPRHRCPRPEAAGQGQ